MRSADTVIVREFYESLKGNTPLEIAPRLLIIGDFPAGPVGLTVPRSGAGMGVDQLSRYFSDGGSDYNTDFARVFGRSTFNGVNPGAIDVCNIKAADAVSATTELVRADQTDGASAAQFQFKAAGPGEAYNERKVIIECTRVIAEHPAGTNVPVCRVTVESPNPRLAPLTYENLVFTAIGNTLGNSGYHRTVEAKDRVDLSRIVTLEYDVDANTGLTMAKGDVINLSLSGGNNGSALTDEDYTDALDTIVDLPFKWAVIPNPPSETVRSYLHTTIKQMPFAFGSLNQMYGETFEAFATWRDNAGVEADDGDSVSVFGWGPHSSAGGREVHGSAAWLGRWSAKINAVGLGGAYTESNVGLYYSAIAQGDNLTASQRKAAAAAGINFLMELPQGGIGMFGYWTLDSQVDRMGDASVRVIRNDIIRRYVETFTPLAQNRPNNVAIRDKINRLGNQVLEPYISLGYVTRADTGTFDLTAVQSRFPGVTFPDLPGWAVHMASVEIASTLGGILVHMTNSEVAGLQSLIGGSGGDEDAPAESEGEAA